MSRKEFAAAPPLHSRILGRLRSPGVLGLGLGIFVVACAGEGGEADSGDAGDGAVGSGGDVGVGGSQLPATGGVSASGGTASGGTTQGAGGAIGTGGSTGGAGEEMAGGSPGSGGAAEGDGGSDTGGTGAGGSGDGGAGVGGSGAGGGSTGTCEKGTTAGNEVLFIGESFVAASSIPEETASLAQAAGSLGAGESYVDKSVSGTWIGNGAGNSIPNQYKDNSSGVRFVLMNGGGNDCWQGGQESDRTNALNAAAQLFQDMDQNGVEKIVYFFYPDPIGDQFASLTACLDLLRPEMKALCDGQASPECHWVDLREAWEGHPEYTSDGIHVAGPGNAPTAAAIFASMEENCVAP